MLNRNTHSKPRSARAIIRRRWLRSTILAGTLVVSSRQAFAINPALNIDAFNAVTTSSPDGVDWLSLPLPTNLPDRSLAAATLSPRPLPPMDVFEHTQSVLERPSVDANWPFDANWPLQATPSARMLNAPIVNTSPVDSVPVGTSPAYQSGLPDNIVRQPTPAEVVAQVEMPNGVRIDLHGTETMADPHWLGLPVPHAPVSQTPAARKTLQQDDRVALARPRRLPMTDSTPSSDPGDLLDQGLGEDLIGVNDAFRKGTGNRIDEGALEDQTLTGIPKRLPAVGDLASANETPGDFANAAGMSPIAERLDCTINDFSATPLPSNSGFNNPYASQWVYDSKAAVPTQRPLIEWGRLFYGDGITPRGIDCFGPYNMVRPQFYLYGDYRTAIAAGRNAAGRTDNWSSLLNLDMDFRITDTERFHGFIGPLNRGGDVSGVKLVDGELDYESVVNPNFVTAYFEGDLGAMWGGFHNQSSPMELPFTVGLVPLLFQNGVWMEDAVTGAAFALPARHSRLLNWANFDVTFFAAVDQINSAAFGKDNHAAQLFGNAWFIEAYGGYIEAGYAFVRDRTSSARSYHNMTASFTRRYFDRISNSVRVIINSGQDLAKDDRTADGGLLLVENSWITASPLTVVPYANFFYGWGRPQSVARAANAGGILRNTGINFDTDGVNGFATLDPTGADTAGGSIGIDLIGNSLDRQLLLEASYLTEHGNLNSAVDGDQFGLGARYQFPISHATLLRFDVMHGWRGDLPDVYGTRMEYRWKF
ncbi:hypothetical protein [Rhodopirellula sallentina]|uniref:Signal peptide protein n=1 Tax=Rhodopirellula sallentina SM41 TaxID=1263870 RepID=M5UFX0_9BACT|nr:hypothetical protein [Rhodopirellula sallentina]EMI56726.1 signal peptide protein [Rhodopirellula sallentina SM41]